MKKILLIEDRAKRQELFIEDTGINLLKFEDILDNKIDEDYYKLILEDKIDLSQYGIIISHKSVGNNSKVIDKLKEYCKSTKTPLILFSGGISANYYNDEEYIVMEINSKTFYSQNLEIFLKAVKEGNENILMLPYGKRWRLSIVLNIFEKINLFIEQNNTLDKVYLNEFNLFVEIEKLNSCNIGYSEIVAQNGWTTIDELKTFRQTILDYISEQVDE